MDKDFFLQLDESMKEDTFLERYHDYSNDGLNRRNMFLTKVLTYLISTRDFKNLKYYLENFSLGYFDGDYRRCFPYDYLEKKGLSKEESEKLILENYIKNGFFFHITPETNINTILQNGLQTLNDRNKKNMYEETLKVNKVYEKIAKRNRGMFFMPTLINIPGGDIYLNEERFNSIYLTSNLDYALKTYGLSGEISTMFVRDFFTAFKRRVNVDEMDKEELRINMIETLEEHPATIYDDEIESILGFFNRIYREKETTSKPNQSIVMVPIHKIESDEKSFEILYKSSKLNYAPEVLIDFNNGEVANKGSISPYNLTIVKPEKDKVLTLKNKCKK